MKHVQQTVSGAIIYVYGTFVSWLLRHMAGKLTRILRCCQPKGCSSLIMSNSKQGLSKDGPESKLHPVISLQSGVYAMTFVMLM